ncbi:MAG: hypothetical protein WC460_03355 [Patescibacteria group bacterium]
MESYDDPAKRLSREKIREFINKHLIKEASYKPTQLKIVCLETPEALEIKEVYDKLGILRKNITILEQDPIVAQRIENQNLGVTVENCWDYEYFQDTDERFFRIISLDYKCKKNANILKSISLIANRQLLAHGNSALIINTLGRRESWEQDLLISNAQVLKCMETEKSTNGLRSSNELLQSFERIINTSDIDLSISQARDLFTTTIMVYLSYGDWGRSFCQGTPLLFCYPDSSEYTKKLDALYKEKGENILDPSSFEILITHHQDNFIYHLVNEFQFNRYGNDVAIQNVIYSIILLLVRPYYVNHIERYKYISTNGTPMETDLYHLVNYEHIIRKAHKIFSIKKNSQDTILRINTNQIKNFKKVYHIIYTSLANCLRNNVNMDKLPERIFLGSSTQMQKDQDLEFEDTQHNNQIEKKPRNKVRKKKVLRKPEEIKPTTDKELITKEQAIELLKSGCNPKEIANCFSGFSARSLSAIQAHITMGTYKK